MIECKAKFDGAKVSAAAQKGGLEGLFRAAAFLMQAARQKIRFRKRKTSAPGAPPFQHSHGQQSFRHTIQFAIDKQNLTAYIGPQKIPGKVGKDVPRTLEFGGMTGPAANPTWYKTDGVPAGLDSTSAIASWLLQEGYGPLFMGGSESAVVNQARKSARRNPGSDLSKYVQQRRNPGTKKTIYYMPVPIRSAKQAEQAAENIVRYYGLPKIKPHYISPRPFMGPTLENSKNSLAHFFRNTI